VNIPIWGVIPGLLAALVAYGRWCGWLYIEEEK